MSDVEVHEPARSDDAPEAADSPWQLLARNPVFTRLWLSQVLSAAGDWLSFVALLALVLELSGSGMSVAWLLLCTSVPSLLVAPFAGVVADRLDRRRVLVAADMVRVAGALGLLLIRAPEDVWIAYVLTALNVVASGFFAPTAAAALPNLVTPRQLTAANALAGATSGVMMAVGAWLGGLVASHLGRPAAFSLDALTFLVSALVLLSVRRPFSAAPPAAPEPGTSALVDALRRTAGDLREACSYALARPPVLAVLLLKTGAGLAGGLLALLSVLPMQVFRAGDFGVGLLYAMRGLGSIAGAVLAQGLANRPARTQALSAALGLLASGVLAWAVGAAGSLPLAAAAVFGAFLGAGLQWVFSSALLQRTVEDRLLGRIFALDNAGMTLTASISTLLCGWGIEALGPRPVAFLVGAAVILFSLAWLVAYAWLQPLRFRRSPR